MTQVDHLKRELHDERMKNSDLSSAYEQLSSLHDTLQLDLSEQRDWKEHVDELNDKIAVLENLLSTEHDHTREINNKNHDLEMECNHSKELIDQLQTILDKGIERIIGAIEKQGSKS